MRSGDFQYPHRAQLGVDRDLRQMRPESEHGVRYALAVFVQRAGGWIEGGFAGEHIAVLIERQIGQRDSASLFVFQHGDRGILKDDDRALASVSQAEDRFPQLDAGHLRGFAGDKSLAGGGSLATVGADRCVA